MSYFAFIPKSICEKEGFDPNCENSSSFLNLNAADAVICDKMGVECDKDLYYKNWKDLMFYSQYRVTKSLYYEKPFVVYKSIEEYINVWAANTINLNISFDKNMTILEEMKVGIFKDIRDVLSVVYDEGYYLVGVFN